MRKGVIGLDFGSLSCRGVLMDPGNGAVLAEAEWPYRHGILSVLPDGSAVPEGYVLQDPSDFREALYEVVKALLGMPCLVRGQSEKSRLHVLRQVPHDARV